MATPFLPGIILLPARSDDRVAKRARDEDLLFLSEEADARGWSSAVPERSVALRRRRGPASNSSPRGCGWVAAATAGELGCRCEEAVTPDAVGAGTTAEETATVDPSRIAYFCNLDLATFDPPLMTTPVLPACAFLTDLDSGIVILDARIDHRVAADTTDEHGCRPEEAATTDAVGSGPAAAEEMLMVHSFLSYFYLTL